MTSPPSSQHGALQQEEQHHHVVDQAAPPPPPPPSTFEDHSSRRPERKDDDSLQFSVALQELRDIRPHLYSAAEYCESAYMYSDQKHTVFDNLKDYSVKALVNAVDHIGTVAFKLNELLGQDTTDISVLEVHTASLTQRLQACYERRNTEGLKQYQHPRSRTRHHRHYVLTDAANFEAADTDRLGRTAQPGKNNVVSGTTLAKSLSWHLAVEGSPTSSRSVPNSSSHALSHSSEEKQNLHSSFTRSISGGQASLHGSTGPIRTHSQISSSVSSRSLLSLLSFDESKQNQQSPAPPPQATASAHKKHTRMLTSLLSRNKSGIRK